MIGRVVNTDPADRISGTLALNVIAILNGANIVRVHDIKEHYQAIKVLQKYFSVNNISN